VSDVLGFVGIGLMLALGLNIIVGNAGLLHLGFVVFYTIGAYTTALLMGASPVTALGIAPRSCRSTSLLRGAAHRGGGRRGYRRVDRAPTVRLRATTGDRHAGVQRDRVVLVQSDWLKNVLGGPQGLRNIPPRRSSGSRCGARSTSTTWRWRHASSASSSPGA
jgi:hypothetical protein